MTGTSEEEKNSITTHEIDGVTVEVRWRKTGNKHAFVISRDAVKRCKHNLSIKYHFEERYEPKNNPNCWYIYVGCGEPGSSLGVGQYTFNGYGTTRDVSIRLPLDVQYPFEDSNGKVAAYVKDRTVYVACIEVFPWVINEIIDFINAGDYEKTIAAHKAKKFAEFQKRLFRDKIKNADDNVKKYQKKVSECSTDIIRYRKKLEEYTEMLNLLNAKMEGDVSALNDQVELLKDLGMFTYVDFLLKGNEPALMARTKHIRSYGRHGVKVIYPMDIVVTASGKYWYENFEKTFQGYRMKSGHPHIITKQGSKYTACLGNIEKDLTDALSENNLMEAIMLLANFLGAYNASDVAGATAKNFEQWEDVFPDE